MVTHYDNSIKIGIIDVNKNKEYILDNKGGGKYSGDGIDAVIDEASFSNTIIININAQKELKVNLTIFEKHAEAEKRQGVTGFGGEYSMSENSWLMTNKSIVITARN